MKEQKYSQAEGLLQRMIEKRKKDKPDPWVNGDKDPPQWMEYTLATVYETAGQWKEAEPLYRDCLTYYEKTGDTRNRRQVMTNLAKILTRTHRGAEAQKLEARLKAI